MSLIKSEIKTFFEILLERISVFSVSVLILSQSLLNGESANCTCCVYVLCIC